MKNQTILTPREGYAILRSLKENSNIKRENFGTDGIAKRLALACEKEYGKDWGKILKSQWKKANPPLPPPEPCKECGKLKAQSTLPQKPKKIIKDAWGNEI